MINEKVLKENIKSYKDYPIPGITYFDLNPIYKSVPLRDELVAGCHDIMSSLDVSKKDLWHTSYDYIAVIESRGFLIGSMLAEKFNKGLILLRSKPGRLPGKTSLVKAIFLTLFGKSTPFFEYYGKTKAEAGRVEVDLEVNLDNLD